MSYERQTPAVHDDSVCDICWRTDLRLTRLRMAERADWRTTGEIAGRDKAVIKRGCDRGGHGGGLGGGRGRAAFRVRQRDRRGILRGSPGGRTSTRLRFRGGKY